MTELIDDSNPLVALLSQPVYQSTPLDNEIRGISNPQPSRADPVIVIDEDSNDDNNISLNFRQPSFTSLSEIVITKGGDVVDTDLPDLIEDPDPIIVFDRNSYLNRSSACLAYSHPETQRISKNNDPSESENSEPIALSIRQPSFTSLFGQIIPKGCESLSAFEPILEEAQPNQLPEETMNLISKDEEDPQIILVQELKAKNEKRWKEIGYVPPDNLIPLVRAASQYREGNFFSISNNGPMSQSQDAFQQNNFNNVSAQNNLQTIEETPEDQSYGLKLGQIQNKSIEMMHEIIKSEPIVQEMTLQDLPDDEDDDFSNEPLFGRLNELDKEILSPIYKILQTGTVESSDNLSEIKQKLRIVADECIENLWVEETAYLNDLIAQTNQNQDSVISSRSEMRDSMNQKFDRRKFGFWKENPDEEIKKVKADMAKEIEDTFDNQLKELEQKRNLALQELEKSYIKESQLLDEKFQDPAYLQTLPFTKPSKQLLDMRYTATKLLKQNRIDEAKALKNRIVEKEKAEETIIAQKVSERYHFEDRKIKDDFAKRRSTILQKYQKEQDKIIKAKNERIQIYQKKITILERQIEDDKEYEQILSSRSNDLSSPRMKSQASSSNNKLAATNEPSLKIGQLTLKPPKKLNRDNDLLILENMTNLLLEDSSNSHKIDVDEIFRKTIK